MEGGAGQHPHRCGRGQELAVAPRLPRRVPPLLPRPHRRRPAPPPRRHQGAGGDARRQPGARLPAAREPAAAARGQRALPRGDLRAAHRRDDRGACPPGADGVTMAP